MWSEWPQARCCTWAQASPWLLGSTGSPVQHSAVSSMSPLRPSGPSTGAELSLQVAKQPPPRPALKFCSSPSSVSCLPDETYLQPVCFSKKQERLFPGGSPSPAETCPMHLCVQAGAVGPKGQGPRAPSHHMVVGPAQPTPLGKGAVRTLSSTRGEPNPWTESEGVGPCLQLTLGIRSVSQGKGECNHRRTMFGTHGHPALSTPIHTSA